MSDETTHEDVDARLTRLEAATKANGELIRRIQAHLDAESD